MKIELRRVNFQIELWKTMIFLFVLIGISISSYGQSYLGVIIKKANLREGPGTEYVTISQLKKNSQIFIVSIETNNDFYNVIDIDNDIEGYIHKSLIRPTKQVEINEPGMFTSSGELETYDPKIEIYNNTSKSLTLKLNTEVFYFRPQETKNITLSPGQCSYRASAPGVIPNIGVENISSRQGYKWQFYITSTWR
jgi:hypothetical protein